MQQFTRNFLIEVAVDLNTDALPDTMRLGLVRRVTSAFNLRWKSSAVRDFLTSR